MGYIRKALEKGYLEHPGSACCTDDMFEIFVRFGRCMCCLLPAFFNRQLPCLHTNSRHPLTRKRARSGGAEWVQVTRHEPGSRAKKPRTSRSQPPACSHKEHDILMTAEATAFAAQFWDRKTHPQQGFAT